MKNKIKIHCINPKESCFSVDIKVKAKAIKEVCIGDFLDREKHVIRIKKKNLSLKKYKKIKSFEYFKASHKKCIYGKNGGLYLREDYWFLYLESREPDLEPLSSNNI